MKYDLDQVIERRGTDSNKWQRYGDDVIPLWVADMDFISADPSLRPSIGGSITESSGTPVRLRNCGG